MPTLLKDDLPTVCKMQATKQEIVQHFFENKGTLGKFKIYDISENKFKDIDPVEFLESAHFDECEFYLYLSSLGNTIHILI